MSEPTKSNSPAPQTAADTISASASSQTPQTQPNQNPFIDSIVPSSPQAAPSAPASTTPPPSDHLSRELQSPPTAPQNAETAVGDPRVAGLKAMFPDYEEAILLMILESARWNEASAVEILLGMSDPNYKPEPAASAAPAAPAAPTMTQEDLDEQLARRLALEEQESQARWYDQQGRRPNPERRNSRPEDPYQIAHGGPAASPNPQGGLGGPNTMAEIQDSLTKAAEVGKKTLGGLFTKVKAKIQEFEQGRSTGAPQQQTQWVGGYDPQSQQQQQSYASYQPHHGSAGEGTAASPPRASYYDPNAQSSGVSGQTISPPSRTSPPVVQGYDVSSNTPPPATTTSPSATSSNAPASGASSVPPPATGAAPIDGGKLGLLPKRPVSLIRDQQPRRSLDGDDDGLEYAENPFEEQKK